MVGEDDRTPRVSDRGITAHATQLASILMSALRQERKWRPSFSLGQRLGDLARAVDEKLGDWAERAALQGNDSIWPARRWQFNRQDLELRALGEKSKCGSRENGDKTAGRQQTNAHMRAIRDYTHPRIIEPAGAKSVQYDRSNHAVRRWQHPQFVQQFGNFDPAPPHPLIFRTCRDDIGIIKEKFEVVARVCDRAGAPYDQEIDITLGEFPVQRLGVPGH